MSNFYIKTPKADLSNMMLMKVNAQNYTIFFSKLIISCCDLIGLKYKLFPDKMKRLALFSDSISLSSWWQYR